MKIITLVVSFALFAFCAPALRASGITVEKWKYDPETKILSVKLVNTSGKIITALGLSIIHKYADGTTDELPDGQMSGWSGENWLGGWIMEEMRKGTPTEGMFADSVGFLPGAVKYNTGTTIKDVVDVKVTVYYVIYADATAEVGNEQAFRMTISGLKDELAGYEKVRDIVKQALADPGDSDPVGTARLELSHLADTLMRKGRIMDQTLPPQPDGGVVFQAVSDLDMFRNPTDNYGNPNGTPREALKNYLTQTEKHIALLRPFSEITPTSEK